MLKYSCQKYSTMEVIFRDLVLYLQLNWIWKHIVTKSLRIRIISILYLQKLPRAELYCILGSFVSVGQSVA